MLSCLVRAPASPAPPISGVTEETFLVPRSSEAEATAPLGWGMGRIGRGQGLRTGNQQSTMRPSHVLLQCPSTLLGLPGFGSGHGETFKGYPRTWSISPWHLFLT